MDSNISFLSRLPPEIILKIFKYLDAASLFCVGFVNRQFHELANNKWVIFFQPLWRNTTMFCLWGKKEWRFKPCAAVWCGTSYTPVRWAGGSGGRGCSRRRILRALMRRMYQQWCGRSCCSVKWATIRMRCGRRSWDAWTWTRACRSKRSRSSGQTCSSSSHCAGE